MPNITVTEAQELVTRFKSAVEEHELATNAAVETEATLREVVYEIHKREAWKALNYKDFKSFINKVLPITKSQAYRLIEGEGNRTLNRQGRGSGAHDWTGTQPTRKD